MFYAQTKYDVALKVVNDNYAAIGVNAEDIQIKFARLKEVRGFLRILLRIIDLSASTFGEKHAFGNPSEKKKVINISCPSSDSLA